MNASSRIVKQLQSELEIAVYARNGDDEKELRQPSCAVTWTLSCTVCEKRFSQEGISSDIMCSTMNTKCSICEKRVMMRRNFIRHHVYALNARNNFSQVNSTNILSYNEIVENVINDEKLWWMREMVMTRKKFIRHHLLYHEIELC